MQLKVIVENEVYRKVMHWIDKSQYEVSGLGTLKIEENGLVRITSAMLLPQKNTSTHTDIEADAVCKAMFELRNAEGELKWWWHSHVKMPVFWSKTDEDTIKDFGQGGWIVATVFNQKRESRSAFYSVQGQVTPWGALPLFIDQIETLVTPFVDDKSADWDAEYTKNVQNVTHRIPDYGSWDAQHGWNNVARIAATIPHTPRYPDVDEATIQVALAAKDASERPEGMSKKHWKYLRKTHRQNQIVQANQIVTSYDVDDYGFTQDERTLLAQEGFDENDIDYLVEEDFTPKEILECALRGVTIQDLTYLISQSHTPSDIVAMAERLDDVPVADRGDLQ